jgi:hypothetical protein
MPPKSKAGPKRGKGNPQGGDVDSLEADGAQELLASLAQGNLTLKRVLSLAKADAPRCDGQCKDNKKGNPNCLCGLTPALGSFRKKGLWQKEPSVLSNLGPDPNLLKLQVGAAQCALAAQTWDLAWLACCECFAACSTP